MGPDPSPGLAAAPWHPDGPLAQPSLSQALRPVSGDQGLSASALLLQLSCRMSPGTTCRGRSLKSVQGAPCKRGGVSWVSLEPPRTLAPPFPLPGPLGCLPRSLPHLCLSIIPDFPPTCTLPALPVGSGSDGVQICCLPTVSTSSSLPGPVAASSLIMPLPCPASVPTQGSECSCS